MIVGAKETSSPIAIFGIVSLVLCCIIWLSSSLAVILIGVRREMYVVVGMDGIALVASWWDVLEMDLSDDVRARLDARLIEGSGTWCGWDVLTWRLRVCSVMMLRSSCCSLSSRMHCSIAKLRLVAEGWLVELGGMSAWLMGKSAGD